MKTKKPTVAFICVHNSCRSQIAEALSKQLASDAYNSYSAGTKLKSKINQDAIRIVKGMYQIDMEQTQFSKLITVLPPIDIVITMGCNVQCPYLPHQHLEDWGLEDPTGKNEAIFIQTIKTIEKKVLDLKQRIEQGLLR